MTVESELAPVVVEVSVEREVSEAFRFFTEEIGSWWPIHMHSIGSRG